MEWVACAERMPAETNDYLVTYEDGTIGITGFWAEIGEWLPICEKAKKKVVAWLPLPQPYEV